MKNGKRSSLCLLLLSCLLLCSCSTTPLSEPPENSRMNASSVIFQEGEITYEYTVTVSSGQEPLYYHHRLQNGVEWMDTRNQENRTAAELTYGQFAKLLPRVIEQLGPFNISMGYSSTYDAFMLDYYPCHDGMNVEISQQVPDSPSYHRGYFVYSLKKGRLRLGDGVIRGEDQWGCITVRNSEDDAYAYILIAD